MSKEFLSHVYPLGKENEFLLPFKLVFLLGWRFSVSKYRTEGFWDDCDCGEGSGGLASVRGGTFMSVPVWTSTLSWDKSG